MTQTIAEIIAKNIKSHRNRLGLSQKALSELLAIDQSHLSRIESATFVASLEILSRIAEQGLGIPVYQLLKPSQTDTLSQFEKYIRLEELPDQKRAVVDSIIDAFLHEQELLAAKRRTEFEVLEELKEIRKRGKEGSTEG